MTAEYDRPEHDYYKTPDWVLPRFLRTWAPTIAAPASILEPAAGDGALLPALRETWPDATIDPYDLEPRSPVVKQRSIMWFDDAPQRYDLVITNPPYIHAEAFVHYGLERLNPGGHLALCLRLDFLGSRQRVPLWKRGLLEAQYVLTDRPSFKGGGTDSAYTAWFVWGTKRRKFWKGYVI